MKNFLKFYLILALLSLSACASMQSDYSCSGVPDGVVCKDPVDVYKLTENRDHVEGCKDCKAGKEKKGKSQDAITKPARIIGRLNPTRPLQQPLPVMEPAKVLRVWIAPWIDNKQDLRWPGYVFTEITPRRWSMGQYGFDSPTSLVPVAYASRPKPKFRLSSKAVSAKSDTKKGQ